MVSLNNNKKNSIFMLMFDIFPQFYEDLWFCKNYVNAGIGLDTIFDIFISIV
jgi:hypothetical protein